MEVPARGWGAGMGLLAGTLSYALMAITLLLSIRRPLLERLFGPLDRVYRAHRLLGTATLAGLGVHLLLRNDAEVSAAIDLGTEVAFRPLGVAGAILLVLSVILALVVKIPYHRWKPAHIATALVFLLLTAHAVLAARGLAATPAFAITVGAFALVGLVSVAVRLIDKARGGIDYDVVGTRRTAREVEITLAPAGRRSITPPDAGQFAFLTASAGGRRETHPFTLSSAGGSRELSFTIRALGDWTARAQEGIGVGDRVRLDGPFGAFAPGTDPHRTGSQVWLGAGVGVTPFVSALRTAASDPAEEPGVARAEADARVEVIVAARDADDVPCWGDIVDATRRLPWVTLTTTFRADGDRLDEPTIDAAIRRQPPGTEWFLCGPSGLTSLVMHRLRAAGVPRDHVHRELFDWRSPRLRPGLALRSARGALA